MRDYWCIPDYEDKFVLLRSGKIYGELDEFPRFSEPDEIIVDTKNFEESKSLWEAFNDFQFSETPKSRKELLSRKSQLCGNCS